MGRANTEPPEPKPPWWEIPGAIQKKFKLYEAACLLIGDEPAWPLPNQRTRDEYKSLLDAVIADKLDEPDTEPSETLAFDAGWRCGDELDNEPSTVHELKIPRQALRKYIKSMSRPVPEFLKQRFDADAVTMADCNKERPHVETAMGKPMNRRQNRDERPVAEQAADVKPDIRSLIEGGESLMVEFKSTARRNLHTKKSDLEITWAVVKTIAAFMNTRGGALLVGVDDHGQTVGIEEDYPLVKGGDRDGWELWLTTEFKNALGQVAATDLSVRFCPRDDKTVALINVDPSAEPVFASKRDGPRDVFFVRLNNSTEKFAGAALAGYLRKHWPNNVQEHPPEDRGKSRLSQDFDWVTAWRECSFACENQVNLFKDEVRRCSEEHPDPLVGFDDKEDVPYAAAAFKVGKKVFSAATEDYEFLALFEVYGKRMEVYWVFPQRSEKGKLVFDVEMTLTENGECLYETTNIKRPDLQGTYRRWEVIRKALEPLFR